MKLCFSIFISLLASVQAFPSAHNTNRELAFKAQDLASTQLLQPNKHTKPARTNNQLVKRGGCVGKPCLKPRPSGSDQQQSRTSSRPPSPPPATAPPRQGSGGNGRQGGGSPPRSQRQQGGGSPPRSYQQQGGSPPRSPFQSQGPQQGGSSLPRFQSGRQLGGQPSPPRRSPSSSPSRSRSGSSFDLVPASQVNWDALARDSPSWNAALPPPRGGSSMQNQQPPRSSEFDSGRRIGVGHPPSASAVGSPSPPDSGQISSGAISVTGRPSGAS